MLRVAHEAPDEIGDVRRHPLEYGTWRSENKARCHLLLFP
jgi:hypothetical protein